ncbi:four-helix bundle copper-binding protein [Halorarius litoreus]|uniref:four-helix bundle copper-binding protein n=1 Tax=Halorarius litoreus TaxID=2962676 RepID=UPI0020CEED49|nr:four-helix bundle copper-binding protein [Halorarius litoreus]
MTQQLSPQGSIGQQQYGSSMQPMQGQSQQFQQQPTIGMQSGQQPRQNITLEEGITEEMRVVLHDFVEAANVTEWCSEQCLDEGPHMAECVRLCRDVADIATLNARLLSRDSAFGPELAELFVNAAEACAQECAQHPNRHCQECAEVLPRAARATRKMLTSLGTGQTQQFQSQQVQGQSGIQSPGQF